MQTHVKSKTLLSYLHIMTVWGLGFIVLFPSILEVTAHEVPCPLCLLQRFGLLMVTYGLLLNLRFGFKSYHYGLSILALIYTGVASIRQILLHITPGTARYGDPFLGLSLYTWVFIVAVLCLIWLTGLMSFNSQFQPNDDLHKTSKLTHWTFIFIIAVTILNLISIFLECGLGFCPANPVKLIGI